MPYIVLNNAVINRNKEFENRFISVSSIIDSPVSSEYPKMITSIEDLDLYFEKDFTWRDYMVELLDQEVGLLLYKPVKEEKILNDIYYEYETFEKVGEDVSYTQEQDLPKEGEEGKLYLTKSELEGPWIWVDGAYYDIRNLPQNIEKISSSKNNRDSLRLWHTENKDEFNFCFPKYKKVYNLDIPTINSISKTEFIEYSNRELSFSFDIKFDKREIEFNSKGEKGNYFTLSLGNDRVLLVWFNSGNQICPLGNDFKTEERQISSSEKELSNILEEIKPIIEEFGYKILGIKETDESVQYTIYTETLSKNRQLNNLPGFYCEPNFSVSNQLLSDFTEDKKRIDFFSRTIGNAKEKVNIKLIKSKRKQGYYTAEISKYNYIEIFTGPIFSVPGEDSLEYQINKNSKIVSCKLYKFRENGSSYKLGDSDFELPEGSWKLSGGEDEEVTYKCYQESLEILKNFSDFKEDFLLIPNIDNYRDIPIPVEYNYFPEYETLLDYARNKDCQVLIENQKTGYVIKTIESLPEINLSFDIPKNKDFISKTIFKVKNTGEYYKYDLHKKSFVLVTDREMSNDYLNNFIFNYQDKDNYLLYFYDQIYLSDYSKRPGFYVFLNNIITGKFETQQTRILYNSPQDERFLLSDLSLFEKLKEKKSNYLSYNNHYYYYDQLFNGSGSQSIITRFILGKIKRKIESEKWSIINKKNISERVNSIGNILQQIYTTYFSVIKNLSIIDIKEDNSKRTLSFTLRIIYTELIDKDIYLNITLNI